MRLCEWPNGCVNRARRMIEGTDPEHPELNFRWWLCEEVHIPAFLNGTARELAIAEANAIGIRTDNVDSAETTAAKAALDAHQAGCAACREVHEWVRLEMLAGNVRTPADRQRVGDYIVAHACAPGVALFEALGRAMAPDPADSAHR